MFVKNDKRSEWTLIGQTEVCKESLNPDWAESFLVDYYFEKNQEIRFEVYDDDGGKKEEQGMHTTTISHLIGAKRQTYHGELKHSSKKGNRGYIIVKTDSVKESNKTSKMTVNVSGMGSMQSCL